MSALETRTNSGAFSWNDRRLLIGALFLLSGVTGLAYEVIWFRRFAAVWGNSSLAIATVVASFLAGLGIGAWLTGRFIRPGTNCLALYGLFELGIAVLALVIPFEVAALQTFVISSLPTMYDHLAMQLVTRSALTLCVLGPPCLLMGGTLPLLVQEWSGICGSSREATSTLYALNTWGAAVGCLCAGFFLLPMLGLNVTNLVLAGTSGAIGMMSLYVARGYSHPTIQPVNQAVISTESKILAADDTEQISDSGLYAVSALTGFAALALQMTWSRQLAVAFGSSTYGFTATLFIMLVGIALGSWLFRLYVRKHSVSLNTLLILVLVLCLFLTAGTRMLPALSHMVGKVTALRSSPLANAGVCIFIAGLLQFVPATCMGILFPMLVQFVNRDSQSIGRTVGNIYAANTVGSVIGTLVTAEFLFPMMGTLKTISASMIIYFASLLVLCPMKSKLDYVRVIVLTMVWLGMSLYASREIDPRQTNLGFFMYGVGNPSEQSVLFFKEGQSSNVLVTRNPAGERALRVNGKVDASSSGDMRMQVGLSYFPMFLRPDAKDVCIVGFGSGASAGTCLRFPNARVTCCEIEPAIISAAKHFTDINHDPMSSDRFSVVLEDARSYLQRTNQSYDLILSEPSNPWIAGVSALFTSEFYDAVKTKLNDNGIFAQWIQMYNLSQADYVMILRTLRKTFPHCILVRISNGDSVLIASESELVNLELINRAEELLKSNKEVRSDLQTYFDATSVRSLLLQHFVMDTAGIDGLIAKFPGGPVNTDINMRLEYDAPLGLFQSHPLEQSVDYLVTRSATAKWYCSLVDRLECGSDQLSAIKALVDQYATRKEFSQVLTLADRALKIDPEAAYFRASKLAFDREKPVAGQAEEIDRIGKLSIVDLNRAGVMLFNQDRFADAVVVFRKVVELHPESATSRLNLAVNLARDGKVEEAKIHRATARTIDPLNSMDGPAEKAIEQSLK